MNMMLIDTAPIKEQLNKAEQASQAYALEIANIAVLLKSEISKSMATQIETLKELQRVIDLAVDRLERLNGNGRGE